eukprot:TRINITY_DN16570_c0_g1_i2.p1 TRINITY_DN16570_c0_g1~~TRINITY_DN16570_c0_g1_i2.p1  ORF type:complete len:305 (+),score=25.49 TRINITY_DN16570_c0_g1_i2:144-1058(+)
MCIRDSINAEYMGGFSRLKDILLGTVPMKLLGKIKSIPMIVVGGIPRHKNVLIAFDGTREVVEAVRRMSRLINSQGYKLLLCHASKSAADMEKPESLRDNPFFKQSVECLTSAGFTDGQLTCELISSEGDLTENIVNRAREGGYESILIGRRNLTFLKQFFHGRVGDKIFQAAGNQVVWVVQQAQGRPFILRKYLIQLDTRSHCWQANYFFVNPSDRFNYLVEREQIMGIFGSKEFPGRGSFPHGIHPPGNKFYSAGAQVEVIPVPDKVVLPLLQHIGAPCESCLLYTSPSPRDLSTSRMPSSA